LVGGRPRFFGGGLGEEATILGVGGFLTMATGFFASCTGILPSSADSSEI